MRSKLTAYAISSTTKALAEDPYSAIKHIYSTTSSPTLSQIIPGSLLFFAKFYSKECSTTILKLSA